jgi:ABC-type Fe3+ transport system permease subunit
MPTTPNNLNTTSLLGTGTLTNFEIIEERPIHASPATHNKHLITIIVLSAILFITIVAFYDIIKVMVNNYWANIALNDINSNNTPEEIQRSLVANADRLQATFIFALICLIIAFIFVPLLYYFIITDC